MHDDMDLSVHLGPEHPIIRDRTLSVPVSSRPLSFDRAAIARFARGFYTIVRHWPREFPLVRMARQARVQRQLRESSPVVVTA